jgi:exopolysaccharide biosynthesis polyprenyl glycosylphosphotransferase
MKRAFGYFLSIFQLFTDIVLVIGTFTVAYNLRLDLEPRSQFTMPSISTYQGLMVMIVVGIIASMLAAQLYLSRRGHSKIDLFYTVFVGVTAGTLLALGASTMAFKGMDYPRWVLAYSWPANVLLLWFSRVLLDSIIAALRTMGVDQSRLLIVGAGEPGRIVYDRIGNSPGLGYSVIGFVEDDPTLVPPVDMPVLGPISALPQIVQEYCIDEVVFAAPSLTHKQVLELVDSCGKYRIDVKVFPDVFQIMSSEVGVTELGGLPLVRVRDLALRGWNLAIKRAMDIAFSAVALVFVSPIMMVAALAIKATSPNGPVFFTQTRVGLDGKPFELIKFRSMIPDAEVKSGPIWAKPGDSRTTWLGRIMRRYSFDELPQLINVLVGEMSLVGPRPERPYFVEQFKQIIPRYEERHREKAGMTGWAQVNGMRGDTSIEERTKYDIYYVENWSPLLDIKILLKTIFIVFKGSNAY